MSNDDERNVDPIQEMRRLMRENPDLTHWGFEESHSSEDAKTLIYDSPFCRIKILWSGWDYLGGNTISIYYGRLHAQNNNSILNWGGEDCYAWHEFEYFLYFLDGLTPAEAFKMELTHPLINKYYEEGFRKEYHRRQPEWLVKMHAEIWGHYGKRLSEVLDLQQTAIWDRYREFLKQYYDIEGRSSIIKPSMDKVC